MIPTPVILTFPARAEYIRLVRLVASGMVARAGFTIDDIEDLRIGVDELCSLLVDHARPDADVTVRFHVDSDVIVVDAETTASVEGDVSLDELSRHILKVAVDEHRVERIGAVVSVSLRKRRTLEPA